MSDPHSVRLVISAVDRTKPALDSVSSKLGELQSIAGVASAAAATGLALLVTSAVDAQDALLDLSKSTALTVEQLAGIGFAAKTSGSELEDVAKGINKLSVAIAKDAEKFAQIGITAKDPLEAFQQLADVFVAIEDPQERAAVAAEALGKSWQTLAPLLSNGGEAIGDMVKRGTQLSGTTTESAERAAELNGQLDQLRAGAAGLSTILANSLVPLLTDLSTSLVGTTDDALKMNAEFNPLTETLRALIVVGGNVAFVIKGIGTEIGGMAAQIAALLRLDFSAFGAIGAAMREDAARNRTAFDAWERRIMSSGQEFTDYSNEGRGRGISPARPKGPSTSAIGAFLGGNGGRGSGRTGSARRSGASAATGSVQDYDAILLERLARAIEQTDIVKAEELARLLEKLDLLAASGLDPALVTAVRDDLTGATKQAADELDRLNSLLEATPTEQIEQVRSDMMLLAKALEDARISEEQYLEAVAARLAAKDGAIEKQADQLTEYAIQAARSMQSALADFLFDPFENGTQSMAKSFGVMLRRMIAEAAAAELARRMFGDLGGKGGSGELGGWVGGLFNWASGLIGGGAASAPLPGSLGAAGGLPLPSLAVGSPYIPRDMVAQLHRGERVLTQRENTALRSGAATGALAPLNLTVNVNAGGTSSSDMRRSAGEIARQVGKVVQGATRYV